MGGMSLASLSPATNDHCLWENMGKHGKSRKSRLKYLGIMINEQKRNHVSMQYFTSPLRQGRTRLSCWKSPVLCHCVAMVCVMRSGHSFLQLTNHKVRIWRYFPPPTIITQMMILILVATHLVHRTACLLSLPLVHIYI